MGKRGILDETGVQLGPMGGRSPMCERLGANPTLPREGAASPSVPLKAVSFSGRFSSSLYFWSQRNSYRGKQTSAEQGVSRQSSLALRSTAPCLLSHQVAAFGRTRQEPPVFVLASCQPSGQICKIHPVGRKYAWQLGVGPGGSALEETASELRVQGPGSPPGHPSSGICEAMIPKDKPPDSSINSLGMRA